MADVWGTYDTPPPFKCFMKGWCSLQRRVVVLTAAMEGFLPSPAGGWVTSAPRKITGCWNTNGLESGDRPHSARRKYRSCSIWMGATETHWVTCRAGILVSLLTCPVGGGCCWHHPAWHWFSDRGWRGSEVSSSEHSSPAHIGLPCQELCLQHVWPQLQHTAEQHGHFN